ncbi:hypothetical protein [Butyrivibrio sp. YAB3001]|uniref:hypothetical protein n=1 Tax=Butyrivibrio sp. YAB3001 TaxID=1520812 RepID=UPI00113276BA|nr:hypothetical protein [Butyrivibrio sp. YAB3001]
MEKKRLYLSIENIFVYGYFLLSAVLFLLLASRSSLLYVCNNWDDANSYFSMGKALFNGKVLYRDVFDQKGMYLYFLYGLAYLVSHTTFKGVFLLEIILGTLDIIGFNKILSLYTKKRIAALLAPLPFMTIVSSRSFWWGGAAEEICLPIYIWGLYILLDYFKNKYPDSTMSFKRIFIGGLLAGLIANIKFTGLGFFFAWMALVWLAFLTHKEFVSSIKACVIFLLGMFVPFVPWIIYFALNHALYDWYWGYVYINVFLYPNEAMGGIFGRIYTMAKILYWLIWDNFMYFAFVILGLFYSLLKRNQKILTRFAAPILFAFMFMGIFIGGRELPYYSLPLSVFSVLGVALCGEVIDFFLAKRKENSMSGFGVKDILISVLLCAFSTIIIYFTSMNIPFLAETKENMFLYRFRDEVLTEDDPTLLNIGCLDAGLYTLTGIVPSCRWFQTQTLDVPEPENNPYKEQDRYIKEAMTDFVIARDTYPEFIFEKYDLIDQAPYSYSGYDFIFYLFKKKQ